MATPLKSLAGNRRVLIAAGLAVVLFLYLRGRGGGGGGSALETSPLPLAPGDGAIGGGGAGGVTGVDMTPFNELAAVLGSRLDDLGTRIDTLSESGATQSDVQAAVDQLTTLYPIIGSADGPRDAGPSGQTTPAAPGNAKAADTVKATGIQWGGRTITTAQQLVAFERAHGNKGFSIDLWARQHPGAAGTLGIKKLPPRPVAAKPSAPTRVLSSVADAAAPTPPGSQYSQPAPLPPLTAPDEHEATAVAAKTHKVVAV